VTAQLVVDIVTNASGAVSGFKKVDQAAATTATKTQSAGSKIAGYAKAIAGAFVVKKVVDFGKESVAAAGAAAQANKRLVAVFKNVGDTTGEASKHAIDFADSLGRQIGVDPEIIKGGEAILATFHSVSDATGRQAGIFDRATAAAADLAAAGFGDLSSNSVQLGKALEDPVKGMTALSKSGVTFTDAQKAQIKALEAAHDHLGAQKVVLAAVEGQVKGTAAATAGAGAKMSVAFKEAQVTIGNALLPYVAKIKQVLLDVFQFVSANSSWLLPLVLGLAGVIVAIKLVTTTMKLFGDAMKIVKGIQQAWTAITKAATAVQIAFNIAMDANPVVLIVIAIVLLVAALVILFVKVQAVRDIMLAVWDAVSKAAQVAFHAVLAIIQSVWAWLQKNWPLVLGILLGPIALAAALIWKYWSQISSGAQIAWNTVVGAARAAVNYIVSIPGAIGRAFAALTNAIIQPFASAWNWIQSNVVRPMETAFYAVISTITGAFHAVAGLWNRFAGVFNAIHISVAMPSNAVTKFLHVDGLGFDWTPPFRLPVVNLASGGVFDRATLAVVGEAGREVVAPEALLRQIVGQGGDTTININVMVPPTANPAAAGRAVVDALRAYVRANGPIAGIAS
jgi:hypothetical protein